MYLMCLLVFLTFIKLGVLREPCSSEPRAGLFGFDLYGEEQVKHMLRVTEEQHHVKKRVVT